MAPSHLTNHGSLNFTASGWNHIRTCAPCALAVLVQLNLVSQYECGTTPYPRDIRQRKRMASVLSDRSSSSLTTAGLLYGGISPFVTLGPPTPSGDHN